MSLKMRDVVLSYGGAPVVNGLDLDVASGEILVLTGPSGCGKSTVLRALARLLAPDGGEVTPTAPASPPRPAIARWYSRTTRCCRRTVRSNVELTLKLVGRRARAAARKRRARSPTSVSAESRTTCPRACPVVCGNASNSPAGWPVRPVPS